MKCFKCKGTKWRDSVILPDGSRIIDEKARQHVANRKPVKWSGVFRCECQPDERVKDFMEGLPRAYRGFDRDYPVMVVRGETIDLRTKALKLIDEYQILILSGGTGNGKTWVSINIAIDWLRQEKPVIFIEAMKLAKYFFGEQGGRGFRFEEIGDEFFEELEKKYTHVIVNDLGIEASGTPKFAACLRWLFDRMERVVVTTNLAPKKLKINDPDGIREIYGETVSTYLKTVDGKPARAKVLQKDFEKIGDRR